MNIIFTSCSLFFKVRVQTQKQFTGIWQCAAATFSKEGVSGTRVVVMIPGFSVCLLSMLICSNVAQSRETRGPAELSPRAVNVLLLVR